MRERGEQQVDPLARVEAGHAEDDRLIRLHRRLGRRHGLQPRIPIGQVDAERDHLDPPRRYAINPRHGVGGVAGRRHHGRRAAGGPALELRQLGQRPAHRAPLVADDVGEHATVDLHQRRSAPGQGEPVEVESGNHGGAGQIRGTEVVVEGDPGDGVANVAGPVPFGAHNADVRARRV